MKVTEIRLQNVREFYVVLDDFFSSTKITESNLRTCVWKDVLYSNLPAYSNVKTD
jgi:hypothetical protein